MKNFLSLLMLCLVGFLQASPTSEKINDKYVVENSISQKNDIASLLAPSNVVVFKIEKRLYDEVLLEYRFTASVTYLCLNKTNSRYYLIKGDKDKHSPHMKEKLLYHKESITKTSAEKLKGLSKDPGWNIFTGVNV